jgi:MFS family permease
MPCQKNARLQNRLSGRDYQFGHGIAIGPLPVMIKQMFDAEWAVGTLLSFYYLFSFFLALYIGKSSDTKGRIWYIILAYVIAFGGLVLFCLMPNQIFLVICVICLAFNFSVNRVMSMALVGDISDEKNTEFVAAILLMGMNSGLLTSLLLSSFIKAMPMFWVAIFVQIVSFVIAYTKILSKPLSITQQKLSQEI